MAKLNREPIIEIAPGPKPRKLNRGSWRDDYPHYPLIPLKEEDGTLAQQDEMKSLVKCTKANHRDSAKGRGFQIITLDVCLHSVHRFSESSYECRRCLGIRKGLGFPSLFLEAKKRVMIPESLKMNGNNTMEEVIEDGE